MYLSRLCLANGAIAEPAFWSAFGSEYALHRAVWDLFGDLPGRRRDFLYRLDSRQGRPVLWTLSERQPVANPGLWTLEARRLAPQLRRGDQLELALRVNPVVTRDGKRHDVVMDWKHRTGWRSQPADERDPEAVVVQAALSQWFDMRAERLGVRVRRLRADGYQIWRFPKTAGQRIDLAVCDLDGVVEVADPERFLAAWKGGVGPAKGFGCGLMLIRRHRA